MKDAEGQWMLFRVQHKNEIVEINALPEEGLTVNRAVWGTGKNLTYISRGGACPASPFYF